MIQHHHVRVDAQGVVDRRQQVVGGEQGKPGPRRICRWRRIPGAAAAVRRRTAPPPLAASVSAQGSPWWYSGFRAGAYSAFGPWYWTMVQIEYAGDSDFEIQGNVFGRPGGSATDRCSRTGHAIRTSGSGGGADSSGNGVLLVRVRERLHRDLRGHHPTCRSI